MEKKKLGYQDFIETVDGGCRPYVEELHGEFQKHGCEIAVKEAKSGYVVSYTKDKKTVANYVFRKKGLILRLYANHVGQYMEFLESLPEEMRQSIRKAPVCKRLLDPEACNPKCATGYDFLMGGERFQKCRVTAFQFLLDGESYPHLKGFVARELAACGA